MKITTQIAFTLLTISTAEAQDYGFRYQWEGKATEAVSYKNWSLTEHPMDNTIGANLGAVCNIAPVSRWPSSQINVCQSRLGTCVNASGQWGFNNLFLAHCGKSTGVNADGLKQNGYHAYGSIVRNASMKSSVITNSDLHELFIDSSNISGSTFYKTNLYNVDLNNVDARNTRFDKTNFVVESGDFYYGLGTGTDFYFGASNFEGSQFYESRVQATFEGSNLRKANFQRVGRYYPNDGKEFVKVVAGNLDSAYFGDALIDQLAISISSVNGLDAFKSDIKKIHLFGARGTNLQFGEVTADQLIIGSYGNRKEHRTALKNLNFSKARIKEIQIRESQQVENLYLGDSEIDTVSIQNSSTPGLSLVRVQTIKKLSLRNSQVTGAIFRNANLSAAKFCKSNLSGSDFSNAYLVGAKYDAGTQLPFSHQVATQLGMVLTDDACAY